MIRSILVTFVILFATVTLTVHSSFAGSEAEAFNQSADKDSSSLKSHCSDQVMPELRGVSVRAASAQAWALAASAILTERNGQRHDLLGGSERNPANAEHWKRILSDWWGVRNREDLLSALEWIDDGGHRINFEKLGIFLGSLDEQQHAELLKKVRRNEQAKNEIAVVTKYYDQLGRKSLLGWDYSRYISLCRWGYLVGYLSPEEAWERIMRAALKLQQTFDSWKDLGRNYLIGREFWSYEETRKSGRLYRDAYERLLNDSAGPWKRNPWGLDLSGAVANQHNQPCQRPEAAEAESTAAIKGEAVSLHSEASANSAVLKSLKKGDTVIIGIELEADDGKWCGIIEQGHQDITGYVQCNNLQRLTQ
jgi:Protein of unknown function (DUF1266)